MITIYDNKITFSINDTKDKCRTSYFQVVSDSCVVKCA